MFQEIEDSLRQKEEQYKNQQWTSTAVSKIVTYPARPPL